MRSPIAGVRCACSMARSSCGSLRGGPERRAASAIAAMGIADRLALTGDVTCRREPKACGRRSMRGMLAPLLTVAMLAQQIEWRAWTPALFEQARREEPFVLPHLEAVWVPPRPPMAPAPPTRAQGTPPRAA